MSTDYIVASLPSLVFGAEPAITRERFAALVPEAEAIVEKSGWRDLEVQLRNAAACARGGERYCRPAEGCSLYWRNRVTACFQEGDVAKREEALDRVWWEAAGELTPPAEPLGKGALATYAVRLGLALKRAKISRDAGNAAFDRLTEETKR